MTRYSLLLATRLALTSALFFTQRAEAASLEPVRLTLGAGSCGGEKPLRHELDELGVQLRAPDDGARARALVVRFEERTSEIAARLVVQDLDGHEATRTVVGKRCEDVVRALALVVATTLEDDPERPPVEARAAEPEPRQEPPVYFPAPAALPSPEAPRRAGSGGLALSALGAVGAGFDALSGGVHAFAVLPSSRPMRLGLALSATKDSRQHAHYAERTDSFGLSGKLGVLVGWEAPWNDSVAGFLGEAGVAAGRYRLRTHARLESSDVSCWPEPACYRFGAVPGEMTFVTPYASASVVLQIPWRSPVRPIAIFGAIATPGTTEMPVVAFTSELGVAWQAW